MTYTITHNAAFDSLEISFDQKPSDAVRDALKALRFRWHIKKHVWYGQGDEADIRAAIDGAASDTPAALVSDVPTPSFTRPAAFDREMLRAQYAMIWNAHMTDYCANRVAALAELPGGELIPVEKHSVNTRFCFGESGYDYDDALRAADHARKSEDYFRRENMREYTDMIERIVDAMDEDESSNRRVIIYTGGKYYDQPAECRLRDFDIARLTEILDAFGGSANLDEVTAAGTVFRLHGRDARLATREEAQIILDAWRAAAQAHEKKVNAYLKRYGMSKVHAWTYWRDA